MALSFCWSHTYHRVHGELRLFFGTYSWLLIALALFDLIVLSSIFRSIAYVRNPRVEPLRDLGWEFIPRIPPSHAYMSELVLAVLTVFCWLLPVVVVLHRPLEQAVSAALLIERWVVFNAIGHFIRAMTFLSTSLPSPSYFCQNSPDYEPPESLASFIFSSRIFGIIGPNGSCGDLIYSGHMLTCLGSVLMIFWYIDLIVFPYKWCQALWKTVAVMCLCLQPILILGNRGHYTVDVVVALYVVPMMWTLYTQYMGTPLFNQQFLPI